MKIQKKIITFFILIVIIIFKANISYCNAENNADENTIKSQEESFGISSCIENSKKYTGEFFKDIDISNILNSAIKKTMMLIE